MLPVAVGELPGVTPGHLALEASGEVVVVDRTSGQLGRMTRAAVGPPPAVRLSDTPWVSSEDPTVWAPDGLPYSVRSAFHSEGFVKTRALFLPQEGAVISGALGDLDLPVGTVALKSFWVDAEAKDPFETRVLRRGEQGWEGFSYRWRDGEATLLEGRVDATVAGRAWTYPSRGECLRCHTNVAGGSLGITVTNFTDESLARLESVVGPLDSERPPLRGLDDSEAPVDTRVRSYLESNCAMCHQPFGPGGAPSTFVRTSSSRIRACATRRRRSTILESPTRA